MKTFWVLAVFLSTLFNGVAATPTLLNSGALTIKLLSTAQGLDSVTASKTNATAKGTTVTTVSKSTVGNSFIQTTDFLKLIENTFSTNFPPGSQLVMGRNNSVYHLWVADSTGTNMVLNMWTNVFIGALGEEQPVHAGTQTIISKTGNSGASVSGNLAETVTQAAVLNYDDSGVVTQDGTHTKFSVAFLLVRKTSENLVTQQIKDTVKLQGGIGNGIVRDQNVVLQGTGSATIIGVLNPPLP